MRDKLSDTVERSRAGTDENFLQRFSRLKTEAREAQHNPPAPEPEEPPTVETEPPGDDDMPPLDTLTVDSDFSGFLSPKVSDALRTAALRKLFHSSQFNVIDELDDYAEDFTTFRSLGDIVTADMKHQIEVQAKRVAESVKQQLLDDDTSTAIDADQTDQADEQATTDNLVASSESNASNPSSS